MKLSIAAFLIVLASASLAWAGTKSDREELQKIISKVAPADSNKSKTGCVCLEPGGLNQVGRLYHFLASNQIKVSCDLRIYNAEGQAVSGEPCSEFMLLR